MNRQIVCVTCITIAVTVSACSQKNNSTTTETNQSAQSQVKPSPSKTDTAAQSGELQPGQASGTYTAKGEVVELKYAYAGRAERFGSDSLVILLTDKPIPSEAVAEEIKSATL